MIANPLRSDPTRLIRTRAVFCTLLGERIEILKERLKKLLIDDDALGLIANTQWQFLSDSDKVKEFKAWIDRQVEEVVVKGQDSAGKVWWNKHVADAYQKGYKRSHKEAAKTYKNKTEEHKAAQKALIDAAKSSITEKADLLIARTYTELKGVSDETAKALTRILTDGLLSNKSINKIADEIEATLEGYTKSAARRVAQTELTRAHAEGQLDAIEKLGHKHVKIAVEWDTRDDGKVCKLCRDMDGKLIPVKEARGMLPRHPNCRCAFKTVAQNPNTKKNKEALQKAIKASLKAELPNKLKRKGRSVSFLKKNSNWKGKSKLSNNQRTLARLYPPLSPEEVVEEYLANADCGTGKGGFKHGNKCAVGGSRKPKKTRTPKPKLKKQTKSAIAKASQNHANGDDQEHARKNENKLAVSIYKRIPNGSVEHIGDHKPADLHLHIGGKLRHGLEVKTMLKTKNARIIMKGPAMALKKKWEKQNNATMHTVVIDDTAVYNANGKGKHDYSKRRIFYKRGYGSFRVYHSTKGTPNLAEANSMDELVTLITAKKSQLPPEAK